MTNSTPSTTDPSALRSNRGASQKKAVEDACRRIAPLWPLDSFVAVNPFVGLTDLPFYRASARLGLVAGARSTPLRGKLLRAIGSGEIRTETIGRALSLVPAPPGAPRTTAAFLTRATRRHAKAPAQLPTVASVLSQTCGHDWTATITSWLSAWAGAHFDRGQAPWRSPWRQDSPYAAWRAEARHDRTLEVAGVPGFRAYVSRLPDSADELFDHAMGRVFDDRDPWALYLHRLLMDIAGWAGFARYLGFQAELRGERDGSLRELLAIRLACELGLLEGVPEVGPAWEAARVAHVDMAVDTEAELEAWTDAVLQAAHDLEFQQTLHHRLATSPRAAEPEQAAAQLVFCIDVRSEAIRRALEDVEPDYATLGFAGFFGFPIEYVTLGAGGGHAHCPVLMTPSHRVVDTSPLGRLSQTRSQRLALKEGWMTLKKSAVGSFGFVEAFGLGYLADLVRDSIPGRSQRSRNPGLSAREQASTVARHGIDLPDQVERAESMLRGMSLTRGFGRLIVLVGHGSRSTNNPHASGLDCGACGGHSGAPNARVAATVLNEPSVRRELSHRGIDIPSATVFVAAEHDTTTDEVRLIDAPAVPETHRSDLARLRGRLSEASKRARAERDACDLDRWEQTWTAASRRANDWSQVRPEWGLARCAQFIAGPRAQTRGVDLQGRGFLHSYDWRDDEGFAVLENIMTAPMVVASWIGLQYYASTVDNERFGCGDKTLHNVVGGLGVLEGAEGDLRGGLALQSLHDGTDWVHEPRRLAAYFAAPTEAMNTILSKHPSVRDLVDNGWIHLLQLDDQGRVSARYVGSLTWEPADGAAARRGAA